MSPVVDRWLAAHHGSNEHAAVALLNDMPSRNLHRSRDSVQGKQDSEKRKHKQHDKVIFRLYSVANATPFPMIVV